MRTLTLIVCLSGCAPAVHFEPVKAGDRFPQRSASNVEVFFAPPPKPFTDVGTLSMFQPPKDSGSVVSGFRRQAGSVGCDGIILSADAPQNDTQKATCIVWSTAPTAKNKVLTESEKCEQGDSDSCIRAGADAEVAKDAVHALADYQRACDAHNSRGCTHAGIVEQNGGEGVKANPTVAVELFNKSCVLDDFVACRYLGLLQIQGSGGPKDPAHGIDSLEKACTGKDGWACWKLGKLHTTGEVVKKDREKATAEFEQACAADYKPACAP